jgi:ATP-dependent helicase Lhr and Lhr-like helicase
MPSRSGPPTVAGRWSLLPDRETDPTRRAHATAEALLDRHGIVTRGAVMAEHVDGGFAAVYAVLKAFEETGRCRRGYFVEGLGGAQFAMPGAVDRMRALAEPRRAQAPWQPPVPGGWPTRKPTDQAAALVLAATDPANPFGAALPWPDHAGSHRPGRKAGALVVVVDGDLAFYVERGGKSLLSWSEDTNVVQPAADALALAVRDGMLGRLAVERADGEAVLTSPLGSALEQAGFRPTPRGLRMRA